MINGHIENHDVYTAAFCDLMGIDVDYRIGRNGRVVFLLPGDPATAATLTTYNSNPQVLVLDFVQSLKKVRAKMIALRS